MTNLNLIVRLVCAVIFLSVIAPLQCQTNQLVSSDVKKELVEFLIKTGDIKEHSIGIYRSGEYSLNIIGLINGYSGEILKDGVYIFFSNNSHGRSYYLLVEGQKYLILDLSSKEGLTKSMVCILDFCERHNLGHEVASSYIVKMTKFYYSQKSTSDEELGNQNNSSGVKELP